MTLESTSPEQSPLQPEAGLELQPQPELLADALPLKNEEHWTLFNQERDAEMGKMNEIRTQLGIAPTEELTVHLAQKQKALELLPAQEAVATAPAQEGEYVDFEMIQENKEEQGKLQSFYREIESIPMVEYRNIGTYGVHTSGELFRSSSFGVMQPRAMMDALSFYESHQTIDASTAEAFKKTIEPEIEELPPAAQVPENLPIAEEPKQLEEHQPLTLEPHPVALEEHIEQ
jgi:hypothetical protein